MRFNFKRFSFYNFQKFQIIYNYNYRPVTDKEMTLEYAYNNKERQNAQELNYEFSNYINLEEEEYNNFFYINTINRIKFINSVKSFLIYNNYISLCGTFCCGKTVTFRKLINNEINRSFYINLWTVNYLEIDELKNVLKYEYIKLIGKDYEN